MEFNKFISNRFTAFKEWFLKANRITQAIVIILIIGIGWLGFQRIRGNKSQQPQYQTSPVARGTLVVSVTASGSVSTANSATMTTQASGVVKSVTVSNGQRVNMGTPIAEIELDRDARQKYLQALSSYQSAKNAVSSAQSKQYVLQATMFDAWDTFRQLSINSTYTNSDSTPNYVNRSLPEFHIAEKKWLAAEADFKNQQNVIAQGQTAMSSAWLTYQQTSPIIYAPISGIVTGLSLQKGSVIPSSSAGSSNGSSTTSSTQKIASIETSTNPTITVNLSEIDVPKVKIGNKATITLDALPGKTFTGKVISIDTVGSINSGVTSYPTVILLDTQNREIFSKMSASASIITQTKDDVLMVPVGAVQTQNDQSSARVLKNGQVTQVPVEIGISSDTDAEIISGLSEGDMVITGTSTPAESATQRSGQTQSPFSPFGGNFRGGGAGGRGGGGR